MAVQRRNTKCTFKTKSLNNTFGIRTALYTLEQRNTMLKISSCTLCKFNTLNTHGNDQILISKILHIHINLNPRNMTKPRNRLNGFRGFCAIWLCAADQRPRIARREIFCGRFGSMPLGMA